MHQSHIDPERMDLEIFERERGECIIRFRVDKEGKERKIHLTLNNQNLERIEANWPKMFPNAKGEFSLGTFFMGEFAIRKFKLAVLACAHPKHKLDDKKLNTLMNKDPSHWKSTWPTIQLAYSYWSDITHVVDAFSDYLKARAAQEEEELLMIDGDGIGLQEAIDEKVEKVEAPSPEAEADFEEIEEVNSEVGNDPLNHPTTQAISELLGYSPSPTASRSSTT